MEQFLIGRHNRGERTTQFRFAIRDEIIRTEPNPSAHRLQLAGSVIPVAMIDEARFVETLHQARRSLKIGECFLDGAFPFHLRHIGTDDDAAAPPPQR